MNVEDLTNDDLLYEFEYTVEENHYDPLCRMEAKFPVDVLRDEILKRFRDVTTEGDEKWIKKQKF